MRATLGCGTLAVALVALWLVLASDITVESIVTAALVALAVAAWVPLIDG